MSGRVSSDSNGFRRHLAISARPRVTILSTRTILATDAPFLMKLAGLLPLGLRHARRASDRPLSGAERNGLERTGQHGDGYHER